MAKRYPREFRDDVVRVARNRGSDVTLASVAADFGVSKASLNLWMKSADIEDGKRLGTTAAESDELRKANKRIRLLEQENEVLRRAAAYLGQANLPKG